MECLPFVTKKPKWAETFGPLWQSQFISTSFLRFLVFSIACQRTSHFSKWCSEGMENPWEITKCGKKRARNQKTEHLRQSTMKGHYCKRSISTWFVMQMPTATRLLNMARVSLLHVSTIEHVNCCDVIPYVYTFVISLILVLWFLVISFLKCS